MSTGQSDKVINESKNSDKKGSASSRTRRSSAAGGKASVAEELLGEHARGPSTHENCKCEDPDCKLHWVEPESDTETEPDAEEPCNLYQDSTFCYFIKKILEICEQEVAFPIKSHLDLQGLPARDYLNKTVVPILIPALHFVEKQRPPEPIAALAAFLLKNKAKYENSYSEPEEAAKSEENEMPRG